MFVLIRLKDGVSESPAPATIFLPLNGKNEVVIGRHDKADVVFRSREKEGTVSISRFHAKLHVLPDEEKVNLYDLNSTNGVYIDGLKQPANEPIELKPGDIISFGVDPKTKLSEFLYKIEVVNEDLQLPKLSNNEVATKKEMSSSSNNKLAELNETIESLKKKSQEDEEKWRKETDELNERTVTLRAKEKELELKVDKLNVDVAKLTSELEEYRKYPDPAELEKTISELNLKIQTLEEEKAIATRANEVFRAKLASENEAKVTRDRIRELLECPICMHVKKKGNMTLKCGHSVCSDCLKQWKATGKDKCPTCNEKLREPYRSLVLDECCSILSATTTDQIKATDVVPAPKTNPPLAKRTIPAGVSPLRVFSNTSTAGAKKPRLDVVDLTT